MMSTYRFGVAGRNLSILGAIFCLGVLAAPMSGQDSKPAEDPKKKALAEAMIGLDKAVKEKSDLDILQFSKLVSDQYPNGDKAQQDLAVDKLGKALKAAKSPEAHGGIVDSIAKTGGKAASILVAELDSEIGKKNLPVYCAALKGLGLLKDEKSIPILVKALKHKDDDAIAAAATALGNFRDSKVDQKKTLFEEILKVYSPIESAAQKSGATTTAKQKHEKLAPVFEAALGALTQKQGPKNAFEWDQWYRKEGKKAETW